MYSINKSKKSIYQLIRFTCTTSVCLSVCFTMFYPSISFANEAKEAERVRIVADMDRMARRGTWPAVNKKYHELMELGKDIVLPEDHFLAAQASLNLGRIEATCIRIQRTLVAMERIKSDPEKDSNQYDEMKVEAENWLLQLRSSFVPVNISINRSYKGDRELKISQQPFLPEENDALKRAKEMLEKNGEFRGMLPIGDYTIGDITFALQSEQVELLSPLQDQRKTIKVPSSKPIKIAPRVNISGALSSSNNITNTQELNAMAFQGIGFKTSFGIDALIGTKVHAFTELGMHRFGKSGTIPKTVADLYGFQATDTSYTGYFVWVGGQYDLSKIAIAIGPTFEKANISAQGAIKSSLPIDTEFSNYIPMSGSIFSSGLTSSVTYRFLTMGENMLGLSALANISNDSARWYSSYQLALTYAP